MGRGDSSSRARPFRRSRRGRGRGDMNKKYKYNSRYDDYNYDNKNVYDYGDYYNYNYNEGYDYGSKEYSNPYPNIYSNKYNTNINNEVEDDVNFNTGISKKSNSTIHPNFSLGKYNITEPDLDKTDLCSPKFDRNDNFHPIKSPTSRSVSGSPLTENVELNKTTTKNFSESKINTTSTHILPKGPASIIESNKRPNKISLSSELGSQNMLDSFTVKQNKSPEPIIDKLPKQTDIQNQSREVLLEKQKINKTSETEKSQNQFPNNPETISFATSRSSSPNKVESSVIPPITSNSSIPISIASLPKGPMGKIDSSKQISNVSIPDEHKSPTKNESSNNTPKSNNNSLKRSHSIYIPSYPGDDRHKRRAIGTPPIDDVTPSISVSNNSSLMNKEKPISKIIKRKSDTRAYTMQNVRENETIYIDYKPVDDDIIDNIDGHHTKTQNNNENKELTFHNNKNNYEQNSKSEMSPDVSQLEEISFHPSRTNNHSDSSTHNTKNDKTDNSKIEEVISFKNYNQQRVNDSPAVSPEKIVNASQFVNGIISLVKPHIETASEEEKNKEKNKEKETNEDKNQGENDINNVELIEIEKEVVENKNEKEIETKSEKEMDKKSEVKEPESKIENKNLLGIKTNTLTKEDYKKLTDETINQINLHGKDVTIESINKNKQNNAMNKDNAENRIDDDDERTDIVFQNEVKKGIKSEARVVVGIEDHGKDIKKPSDSISAKIEEPNDNDFKNKMEVEKGNANYFGDKYTNNNFIGADNHTSDNFIDADTTIDYSSSMDQDHMTKTDIGMDNEKNSQKYRDYERADKKNISDSLINFNETSSAVTDTNVGKPNVNVGKSDAYNHSKVLRRPHYDISSEGLDINLPSEILKLFKNSRYERIPSFRSENSVIQNFSLFRVDRLLFSTKNLNIFQFDHTMVSTFMPNPEMYSHETYYDLISRKNTHFNWYDHVLPELETAQKYSSGLCECCADDYYYSKLRKIEENLNASDKTSMKFLSNKLHYRWSETLLSMVKTNVNGLLAKNVLIIDRKCDPKKIYSDLSTLSKRGFTFHFVLFSNFFNFPNQGDSLIMTLLDEIYNRRFPWADAAKEITIFKPKPSTQHANFSIKSDIINVNVVYTAKRFSYALPSVEVKKVYEKFSKASLFREGKYVGKLTLAVAGTAFRLSHDSILSLNSYLSDIDMLPEKSKYRQFEFNFRDIFLSLSKVSSNVKKNFDRNVSYHGSILKYGKIENSIYAVQFLISADNDFWLYGSPILIVAKNRRLTFSETKSLLPLIEWHLSDSRIPFKFNFFESTKIKII